MFIIIEMNHSIIFQVPIRISQSAPTHGVANIEKLVCTYHTLNACDLLVIADI